MRIIAGKHRGRGIALGKQAAGVRPTSSFAREAIFNILAHSTFLGGSGLQGVRVADLCCGTGAMGLEALSRGAAHATFVDKDRQVLGIARQNAETFGETPHSHFIHSDVTRLPPSRDPYHILFLDPPYASNLLSPALHILAANGWVDADSIIVIEYDTKLPPMLPSAYKAVDTRKYGRASITLLRLV